MISWFTASKAFIMPIKLNPTILCLPHQIWTLFYQNIVKIISVPRYLQKKPKLIQNINIKTGTLNRWAQSILCQLLMDLWWQSWNGNWSAHPTWTLYLPKIKHMTAQTLSQIFVPHVFELRNIQYSSKIRNIGLLGEEGLIVVWRCWASARPAFQSSVAVCNHARWSHITSFFWIVCFRNGQ